MLGQEYHCHNNAASFSFVLHCDGLHTNINSGRPCYLFEFLYLSSMVVENKASVFSTSNLMINRLCVLVVMQSRAFA